MEDLAVDSILLFGARAYCIFFLLERSHLSVAKPLVEEATALVGHYLLLESVNMEGLDLLAARGHLGLHEVGAVEAEDVGFVGLLHGSLLAVLLLAILKETLELISASYEAHTAADVVLGVVLVQQTTLLVQVALVPLVKGLSSQVVVELRRRQKVLVLISVWFE